MLEARGESLAEIETREEAARAASKTKIEGGGPPLDAYDLDRFWSGCPSATTIRTSILRPRRSWSVRRARVGRSLIRASLTRSSTS